jgi:hypothetical protein
MPRRKYTFNHINNIQFKDSPSKENLSSFIEERTTMTSFKNVVNTKTTDHSSLEGFFKI